MFNRTLTVFLCSLLLLQVVGFSKNSADGIAGDADVILQQSTNSVPMRSKPYEIVITPTVTRMDLRGLIQTVEDDFFTQFNELNTDKNYDIVCYKHTHPMSHIFERVCEPLFLLNARSANSSETTFLLGSVGKDAIDQSQGPANSVSPDVLKRDKRIEFEILQEKMKELNSSDDELRSIGSVLAQLKARLANFARMTSGLVVAGA